MKFLLFLALLPASAFACDPANTQYLVSNIVRVPLGPGGRPVPRDGSALLPYLTLKDGVDAALRKDFCEIRIRLDAGIYDGNVAVTRSAEILGKDRAATLVKGGIFSTAGRLKVWDVGIQGATIRAIQQRNGQIDLNRVSVAGYHFVPNLITPRPAAVELTNSQGSVVGLDVRNGDQPAVIVAGATARVKIFGASIVGNHTSAAADTSVKPARFGGAVEIADGAIANLLLSNVKLNQYEGVLVRDHAQLLVGNGEISGTTQSTGFETNVGPDGLAVSNGSVLEAKNTMIKQNVRAGVLSLNSWVTVRAGIIRESKYGFVNRNDSTEGHDGYNSLKCASLDGTVYVSNELNYLPGDNMPIPGPTPAPCPPGHTCPTPAPQPEPVLVCKSVPLL